MKFILYLSFCIIFIASLHPNNSVKDLNKRKTHSMTALTKKKNVVLHNMIFNKTRLIKNGKKKRNEENDDDDTQEGLVILKTVFPYNRKEKSEPKSNDFIL